MATWRYLALRCAIVLVVALLAGLSVEDSSGAATTQRNRWRLANGDVRNSSVNRAEDSLGVANVDRLRRAWSRRLVRNTNATPLIVKGRVFTHCDFDFCAFRLSSGRRLWRVDGHTQSPRPAIGGGMVVFQRSTHPLRLVAVRAASGKRVWTRTIGDAAHIGGWMTMHKGNVLLSATDGNMYALDRNTGKERWRTRIGYGYAPAASRGFLFTTASDASTPHLKVFRADDGRPAWLAYHDSAAVGAPVVMGGRVFIRTEHGDVYGWETHGCGEEVCHPQFKSSTRLVEGRSHPAAWRGRLYFQTHDGRVHVISTKTGKHLWRTTGGHASNNTPTIANGVMYVADGHSLRAFAARGCGRATCSPLWERRPPGADGLSSRPVVAAGSVVVLGGRDVLLHRYAIPSR